MQRFAQRALERVAAHPLVHLRVPLGRHNSTSSLDHRFERLRDARLPTGAKDANPLNPDARVALVRDDRGGRLIRAGEDGRLLQGLAQCVAIVGVARHGARAHNEVFLQRGCDADVHAELVSGSGFAFADALAPGAPARCTASSCHWSFV